MLQFTTTVALLFGIYQAAQNVIVVTASAVSSVVVDEEPKIISEVREQLKQAENGSIVDVAVGSTFLTTLVAAVTAAELVDTLNGDGPFTVFAPTDEAFDALPDGTLDTLLLPDNIDQLTEILKYHVVSGNVPSDEFQPGATPNILETLLGEDLEVTLDRDGNVMVNGETKVITPDVIATNGIVHVIDRVLLPPESDDAPSAAALPDDDNDDDEEEDDDNSSSAAALPDDDDDEEEEDDDEAAKEDEWGSPSVDEKEEEDCIEEDDESGSSTEPTIAVVEEEKEDSWGRAADDSTEDEWGSSSTKPKPSAKAFKWGKSKAGKSGSMSMSASWGTSKSGKGSKCVKGKASKSVKGKSVKADSWGSSSEAQYATQFANARYISGGVTSYGRGGICSLFGIMLLVVSLQAW